MDIVDLKVYCLAEDLAVKIYEISRAFPKVEVYGLTSQLRRAALSIPLNIAEGFGRYHYKDRLQFLFHARGSVLEVKSLLRISLRLKYISKPDNESLEEELKQIHVKLNNYIIATRRRGAK